MKTKALTLTELLVALAVITLLMVILLPVLARMRYRRFGLTCAKNLSQIGRAILVYGSDYDQPLPCAGGPTTQWGPTPDWQADRRFTAFNLQPDAGGGQATVSSSFYLLVKYAETTPKTFVCPRDRKTKQFKASEYTPRMEDEDAWDFGPNPAKHCSYTYHMPYGLYPLKDSSPPGLAVAADRNPFIDSPGAKAVPITDFNPTGTVQQKKNANSPSHQKDGQNVLFMDSHVAFETVACCGINDDNIYTCWSGPDIRRGAPPELGSQPADKLDSLLVHDPPIPDHK